MRVVRWGMPRTRCHPTSHQSRLNDPGHRLYLQVPEPSGAVLSTAPAPHTAIAGQGKGVLQTAGHGHHPHTFRCEDGDARGRGRALGATLPQLALRAPAQDVRRTGMGNNITGGGGVQDSQERGERPRLVRPHLERVHNTHTHTHAHTHSPRPPTPKGQLAPPHLPQVYTCPLSVQAAQCESDAATSTNRSRLGIAGAGAGAGGSGERTTQTTTNTHMGGGEQ